MATALMPRRAAGSARTTRPASRSPTERGGSADVAARRRAVSNGSGRSSARIATPAARNASALNANGPEYSARP